MGCPMVEKNLIEDEEYYTLPLQLIDLELKDRIFSAIKKRSPWIYFLFPDQRSTSICLVIVFIAPVHL